MKLTIERAALLKALGHVQSAVERRNTIPILSNVLLSAERDRLTFSATDLDMEIIDEALAQVDQPGQITAPAHTLYEIVRKLPEGSDVSLSFTGEDPRLSVSAGRSRFNLPVLPAGDFPVMSSDGLSGRMAVDVGDLIQSAPAACSSAIDDCGIDEQRNIDIGIYAVMSACVKQDTAAQLDRVGNNMLRARYEERNGGGWK